MDRCFYSTFAFLESLVELLVSVVQLEPSVSKRKTSHQLVFLGAYTATLSPSGTTMVVTGRYRGSWRHGSD